MYTQEEVEGLILLALVQDRVVRLKNDMDEYLTLRSKDYGTVLEDDRRGNGKAGEAHAGACSESKGRSRGDGSRA